MNQHDYVPFDCNINVFSFFFYSESSKVASSTSFEDQQKFVEWNNLHNLHDRHTTTSSSSSLSLSLSSSKSSYEHELHAGRYSRSSLYDEYIIPDRLSALKQHPNSFKLCQPASPPDHLMAATPRMGMQSTPIKSEDKASGVDYRNIESIVNSSNTSTSSSNSTPLKREPPTSTSFVAGDIVRNSVIKRADTQKQLTATVQDETAASPESSGDHTSSGCCCQHKCCKHAEETRKILSEFRLIELLKSRSPLIKQLLTSVDPYNGLQNMWTSQEASDAESSAINNTNTSGSTNTCAQDLRAKSESLPSEMDQDIPLDLTINK